MRILVTGGAGYVGSGVVTHLAAAGHSVTVLDPLPVGGEMLLPAVLAGDVQVVRGHTTDEALVRAVVPGHDAVIHLAALVGEVACAVDLQRTREVNVVAAERVARAAANAGITRLVFASTCSNYGVSDPGVLADEDNPLHPLGLYAETKVEAEGLVRSAHPGAAILRFGTVCGPSPRMRFDLLVSELAREAVAGRELLIYAPAAWRPYLAVRDLVRAVGLAVGDANGSVAGGTFNVIGDNLTKRDLVEIVQARFPRAEVAYVDKAPDLRDYRVSGSRFEEATGFHSTTSIADAFGETVRLLETGMWRDAGARRLTAIVPDETGG